MPPSHAGPARRLLATLLGAALDPRVFGCALVGALGWTAAQAIHLGAHRQAWSVGETAPSLALEAALATLAWPGFVAARALLGPRAPVAMIAVLTALGLGVGGAARPEPGPQTPRGVATGPQTLVLFTIDTLRRDHVSAYPDALLPGLTPTWERLAEEGLLFEEAVATAPLTLPSHASMLTGLLPDSHGAGANGRHVRDVPAAPVELRAAGYHTAAFVSSSVLHGAHGLGRWFDVYRDALGDRPATSALWLVRRLRPRARLVKESGDRTVDRALRWLGEQAGPVFVWVHLYAPHLPHAERPGARAAELPDPCGWRLHPSALRRRPGHGELDAEAPCGGGVLPARAPRLASYAGEVGFADAQLGRFLDGLEALGRWDDALLVLAADHGESLTEHRSFVDHQHSLYDPVARVPLLVRWPGGPQGSAPQLVSTAQIADTFRAAAGLPGDRPLPEPLPVALTAAPVPLPRLGVGLEPPRPSLQVAARDGERTILVGAGPPERYSRTDDPQQRFPRMAGAELERFHRFLSERSPPPSAVVGIPLPPPAPPLSVRLLPADADLRDPGFGVEASADRLEAWAPLQQAAEELRERMKAARESPAQLPDDIADALRALGYVE